MANPRLRYHPRVIARDIPRLDGSSRRRVKTAIERKLGTHPEQFAKPLAYTRAGLWSLRIGPWRLIFALRTDEVWILRIGHRRDVYDDLRKRLPPQGD
ncbi:MAG: type II toxin-antitoxin system RelE/ParE family toxin [Acidobacteriota bacterium]